MGLLQFLGMLFNLVVVFSLLAQALAIRSRFGPLRHPLLRDYTRVLVVMALTLLISFVINYFYSSFIQPWAELNRVSLENMTLADIPFGHSLVLIPLALAQIIFSPMLIAAIVPSLFISLIEFELIPISSRQRHMARLSSTLNLACIALILALNIVLTTALLLWGSAAHPFIRALSRASVFFSAPVNVIIYGSMILWAIHGFQTQVFKANPLIHKTTRIVLIFTSLFLVLIAYQEAVHIFTPKLPRILEILACRDDLRAFSAHWLLCGVWGLAGIIVLLRSSPSQNASAVPGFGAADPATPPLPNAESIRAIFSSRGLSDRESQVALHVINGCANKEIAQLMDISYNTVKNHVANIFKKLGAGNRFELIRSLRARI